MCSIYFAYGLLKGISIIFLLSTTISKYYIALYYLTTKLYYRYWKATIIILYYINVDKLVIILRRIYPYSIYKAKKDI